MRGRKPVPTVVKLLDGNPGRRPLNPDEPQHPPIDAEVPAALVDPIARAEWLRLVPGLRARGHATHVDLALLVGYCLKYAQWQALEAEAARHAFVVKAPSGRAVPNPALTLANSVYRLLVLTAAELGITPTSRSRVHAEPVVDAPLDAFTRFQRLRAVSDPPRGQ